MDMANLPQALQPALPAKLDGKKKLETALLWCRRDLRVTDNPALNSALALAEHVIPVYIWAPEEEGQFQPGRCSRWWLHQSLSCFETDLQALGSGLVYRRAKESRAALIELVQETGAQALVFNHLYDPISLVRDNEVKTAMQEMQVHCHSFNGDVLYEPWEVLSDTSQPFTCFEDFWKRLSSMEYPPREILRVPDSMPPLTAGVQSLTRTDLGLMTPEEEESNAQLYHSWVPGGEGAFMALEKFLQEGLSKFGRDRAKTDRSSTSRLSSHIHYGELSIRFIYYVVKQRELQDAAQRASCQEFLRQAAFREYSRYLSFHFPFTHERSLLEHLRATPWKFNHRHFKAWRQGNTGYPMVDASMRELWSTGWLHNRSRVLCASFLVKNLLLPWQWGLKHYWECLLDADLECDALGWQYCSGCLADAHPFDHMLDHIMEGNKYDPEGNYVRRWLPALARVPLKWIHRPWEAPEQVLADAGVELGVTYPCPIISVEESEEHLRLAAAVIRDTLNASAPQDSQQVPYRTAATPSKGPTPSATPQASPHDSTPLEWPPAGAANMPADGYALHNRKRGVDKVLPSAEEEEVVSNMPAAATDAAATDAAATVSSANHSPRMAIAAGDMGAARAAAGHGQAEGSADALGAPQASAEEAAAVVPSISARPPAEAAEEGSLTARVQNDQLSSHDSGEEAASRPQKRAHLRLES